jgi:hypothetical protein
VDLQEMVMDCAYMKPCPRPCSPPYVRRNITKEVCTVQKETILPRDMIRQPRKMDHLSPNLRLNNAPMYMLNGMHTAAVGITQNDLW